MRGKPIQVTLANGQKAEIPRISPFSVPDGIAEKLRYLEDQTRGVTIDRLKRRIMREQGRAERLAKMIDRCNAFVEHAETTLEKKDEYLKKIESFDCQIEGAFDAIEKTGDEIIQINDRIDKWAAEVAAWIVKEKIQVADPDSCIDPDVSIDVCRAALGLEPLGEGVEEEGPLAPTSTNSSGADGLPSVQAT